MARTPTGTEARPHKIIECTRHISPKEGLTRLATRPIMEGMEEFGGVLKDLRGKAGIGIKRLAPELGISYSYLSKLESNQVRPSEDLVERVADYFHYDRNRLLLSADKVPLDVIEILRENPDEAIAFLKKRFGPRHE